eukprot:maker-scaffold_6-snap-gene-7.10-mRNA-1 protein AED:0.31 eAED:0.31 QI:80/1/1/1/1/1/2/75/231
MDELLNEFDETFQRGVSKSLYPETTIELKEKVVAYWKLLPHNLPKIIVFGLDPYNQKKDLSPKHYASAFSFCPNKVKSTKSTIVLSKVLARSNDDEKERFLKLLAKNYLLHKKKIYFLDVFPFHCNKERDKLVLARKQAKILNTLLAEEVVESVFLFGKKTQKMFSCLFTFEVNEVYKLNHPAAARFKSNILSSKENEEGILKLREVLGKHLDCFDVEVDQLVKSLESLNM